MCHCSLIHWGKLHRVLDRILHLKMAHVVLHQFVLMVRHPGTGVHQHPPDECIVTDGKTRHPTWKHGRCKTVWKPLNRSTVCKCQRRRSAEKSRSGIGPLRKLECILLRRPGRVTCHAVGSLLLETISLPTGTWKTGARCSITGWVLHCLNCPVRVALWQG